MRLPVNLQGHVADWSAAGAASFLDWLRDHPWRGGGVCALQCTEDAPKALLVDAVAEAAHAFNRGSAGLRIEWLDQEPVLDRSPVQRMKALLSVDEALPHYEGVSALRRELSAFNFLFIFSTWSDFKLSWWWELRTLAENLSKDDPPVGLCAVILDSARIIDGVPGFDFWSMHLKSDVMSDPDETDASRWRRYLHHRIAWEAGGSLAAAHRIDEHVRGIQHGDDADLENRLGLAAEQLLGSSGAEVAVLGYLAHLDRTGVKAAQVDPDVAAAKLLNVAALWRPPMGGTFDIAPWACRAILRSGKAPRSAARLRSNLVCAPLRGEIMQLCLRAESLARQSLYNRQKRTTIPTSSAQALDRLLRGEDDYLHYPAGYPMPPVRTGDEWSFATFGEFLHAHHQADVLDNYRRLLGLRNAVAHGHYVTWRHVQMISGIRSALSV